MAWIQEQQRVTCVAYSVHWRDEDGGKRKKTFRDLSDAEAFRDALQASGRRLPRGAGISVADKLRSRAEFDFGGCWVWHGRIVRGYGVLTINGRPRRAHRISYEEFAHQIPAGLQLDHLCRNRSCINPHHLEPVTPRENTYRSHIALAPINAAKTQCPQGHPYDEENTGITYRGKQRERYCRTCARERVRRRRAASPQREAAA